MSGRRLALGCLTTAALAVAGLGVLYGVRNPETETLAPDRTDVLLDTAASFARLPDGITHYRLEGPDTGPPVVLVHGFSVPAYIWDSTATALAEAGFRVLRYDLFGRGLSDRPDARYDADLFDRQLVALLDTAGMRGPVHVAGLSMGGWVAATFADRHPERTRSLVLVDPVAGRRAGSPGILGVPVLGPLVFQTLALPGMAEGQLGDFAEPARWPDWPEKYRPQMRYEGFGRALRQTRIAMSDVDFYEAYERVGRRGTPTLLVWGKKDTVVPFALADSVRRAIPQAELLAVEQAGHLPHMEKAAEVNARLVEFLRRTGP